MAIIETKQDFIIYVVVLTCILFGVLYGIYYFNYQKPLDEYNALLEKYNVDVAHGDQLVKCKDSLEYGVLKNKSGLQTVCGQTFDLYKSNSVVNNNPIIK